MIENHNQFLVTKSQMEMLQSTATTFDVDRVAQKIGSKKLAEAELKALLSQINELSAQINEYEKAHSNDEII